jgi:serine-type D-Ala-D-Ala carboxypeptidase (penicillin-binding protein 5/6)
MRRLRCRLALAAALFTAAAPALAAGPDVVARSYLVQNGSSGDVLLASNANDRVAIASITKLMTVLVALEHAKPAEVVTVAPRATSIGESSIHLRTGERLTVLELLKATLIQSANDAAYALADYVGRGDVAAFVSLMNAKASVLGLRDTHFARPDGLDTAGHYSSARDVSRLARAAMRIPLVRAIVRERTATISGGRSLYTWNDLLGSFPGLIGVKTGHTSKAGWSEVAAARGDGVVVYATLLGSSSRAQRNADLAELLAYGLTRYRTIAVVQRSRVYAWAQAPFGRKPLALVVPRRLVRVVRIDKPLVERVTAARVVSLPVLRGQRLGEVRVYDRGRLIARSPLVASRSIGEPDFVARAEWYTGRTLDHIWGWIS